MRLRPDHTDQPVTCGSDAAGMSSVWTTSPCRESRGLSPGMVASRSAEGVECTRRRLLEHDRWSRARRLEAASRTWMEPT